MSEGERKLAEAAGDYCYAVKNGQPVSEVSWRSCRILLTDRRLVLATGNGKQAVPHARIRVPDESEVSLPEGLDAETATPLSVGDSTILVDAQEMGDFHSEYCRAALHDEVILAKYPAVVGGVVQDDAAWTKARFRFDGDRIVLGLPESRTVNFDVEDVGTIEATEGEVHGDPRGILEVEHTNDEGTSVETHFSGTARHTSALEALLGKVIERRGEENRDLDEMERQILMALYSGVSPFEMSDFVGIDPDEVEEIYRNLLELGAVDKVRERTEVALNAEGRNLASEAMSEE